MKKTMGLVVFVFILAIMSVMLPINVMSKEIDTKDFCRRVCILDASELPVVNFNEAYRIGYLGGIDQRFTIQNGPFSVVTGKLLSRSNISGRITRGANYGVIMESIYQYLLANPRDIFPLKIAILLSDIDPNNIGPQMSQIIKNSIIELDAQDYYTNFLAMDYFCDRCRNLYDYSTFLLELLFKESEVKMTAYKNDIKEINFYPDLKLELIVALSNFDYDRVKKILENERIKRIVSNSMCYFKCGKIYALKEPGDFNNFNNEGCSNFKGQPLKSVETWFCKVDPVSHTTCEIMITKTAKRNEGKYVLTYKKMYEGNEYTMIITTTSLNPDSEILDISCSGEKR